MAYSDDITANAYEFGDANYSPTGAFDDNLTGGSANDGSWYAYAGGAYQPAGVIGQDFGVGNEKIVLCYRIYSNGSSVSYNPEDWTFEGSNNGTDWEVLDTRSGMAAGLGSHVWNEFPITNSTAYRYYRLNITANGGGSYLVVQEIEMLLEDIPILVARILDGLARLLPDQGLYIQQHRDEVPQFLAVFSRHMGQGSISGTVAVSGVPASRLVVLFDHYTMRPLASTWSDPVTGAYLFTGLALNRKYLVVCDDYTQTYNAAVADWVVAE